MYTPLFDLTDLGRGLVIHRGFGGSEYDSADAMRFFALRLHETRKINRSSQRIPRLGSTDWPFFTEPRKELKG